MKIKASVQTSVIRFIRVQYFYSKNVYNDNQFPDLSYFSKSKNQLSSMTNFAISTGHELTTETAYEILKAGGNAVDAAIAAFMVAWVAEPCMASGGAGAFANVYAHDGRAWLYDFFAQTPSSKQTAGKVDFFPVEVDFGDTTEEFHIGKGSNGVPGSIAGIFAMHEHLGSMPMKDLVQPAIQAAKEGVVINNFQDYDIKLLAPILKHANECKDAFFPNGELISKGQTLRLPELADFLDYMSREGADAFYKGEIAAKIEADHQNGGGFLTRADLENYKVIIRKPLSYSYKGKTILTNPFPSIGGSIIVLLLDYLADGIEHPLGEQHLMRWYSAMKDLRDAGMSLSALAQQLKKVLQVPKNYSNKHGSTSHLNVVDAKGNAVSLSMTIGEGSGYFVPGTGIHLNNMLGESALLPNGFHSWYPNTRLSSMMAPTIVLDEKKQVEIVLGSGGASRIPSAIAQVLNYLIDYELSLEDAVNYPRVHLGHGIFNVEHGFSSSLQHGDFPDQKLFWNSKSLFFGGVHTICRKGNTYQAVGDDRRDGVAQVG